MTNTNKAPVRKSIKTQALVQLYGRAWKRYDREEQQAAWDQQGERWMSV